MEQFVEVLLCFSLYFFKPVCYIFCGGARKQKRKEMKYILFLDFSVKSKAPRVNLHVKEFCRTLQYIVIDLFAKYLRPELTNKQTDIFFFCLTSPRYLLPIYRLGR